MKSLIKKRIYRISAIVVTLLVCIAAVFVGNVNTTAVYADSDTLTAYESQNVLDDLEGSTIAGVEFDLANYPYDENGKPQILNFVEFGYSPYSNNQGDYNLYIYVYNPTGYEIKDSTVNNRINFEYASGNNADNYSLELLNYSTKSGYESLFYKFKIVLSDSRRSAILKALNQSARVYSISAIDLCLNSSTAIEYEVGGTYTYSGYALGYGSTKATESSLTCTVDGFDRYLNLDVKHTTYRQEGDYYNGEQSQLDSVYFSVPNEYFEQYGEITNIACEWYEYVTMPMLVTENVTIYNAMNSLYGRSLDNVSDGYDYLFKIFGNTDSSWFKKSADSCYASSLTFEYGETFTWTDWGVSYSSDFNESFSNFAGVFYTGSNISYSDCSISAESILAKLQSYTEKLGDTSICDRYAASLFDSNYEGAGYSGKVDVGIDDTQTLFTNHTSKEWWQYMFGGYSVETDYEDIPAILTFSDYDVNSEYEGVHYSYDYLSDLDNTAVADLFLIGEGDVDEFLSTCKQAEKNDETVVLMRFSTSTYIAQPCAQARYSSNTDDLKLTLVKDIHSQWYDSNYSAYVFQETVYLNFDIISLTFTADDIDTVVPVVMSPQDLLSDSSSPLIENYGSNCADISWTTILGILLLVFLLIICAPILPYIAKFIVWVVSLPFKLISEIYKAIKNKANKNKRE